MGILNYLTYGIRNGIIIIQKQRLIVEIHEVMTGHLGRFFALYGIVHLAADHCQMSP